MGAVLNTQYISFGCWFVYNCQASSVYYKTFSHVPNFSMSQLYNIGSMVRGVLFGLAVFFTKRFKSICLYTVG